MGCRNQGWIPIEEKCTHSQECMPIPFFCLVRDVRLISEPWRLSKVPLKTAAWVTSLESNGMFSGMLGIITSRK